MEQRAQPSVGRLVVTAIDMLAGSAQPMEAKLVSALPTDGGWQFEPKWDGFRAMVARVDGAIDIQSKSGKSLARYFPEIVAMLADLPARRFLLDGELILPIGGVLSFDALQQRLHPAASRIEKLSRETPAQLMLFDCLVVGDQAFADHPLSERRLALDVFTAPITIATFCFRPRRPTRHRRNGGSSAAAVRSTGLSSSGSTSDIAGASARWAS